jgi:hypothetical protein
MFAHNELTDANDTRSLLEKTNIEEMKALFAFLHALHDALWELLFNGRKPQLRIEQFILPPAPAIVGQILKPGEIIAQEVRAFFDAVVRTPS